MSNINEQLISILLNTAESKLTLKFFDSCLPMYMHIVYIVQAYILLQAKLS